MELDISIWDILLWVLGFACKEFTWSCFRDSWIIPVFTTAIGAWVIYFLSRIGKRVADKERSDKFDKGAEAYDKEDYLKAIQIWLPLAKTSYIEFSIKSIISWKSGYATAQFALGKMYEDGIGFVEDYKKAKKWYEKGANQKHARSQARLGYLYRNKLGVGEDEGKALLLYKKSAKQGNASGQNNLGFMHDNGLAGLDKDPEEAFHWYEKAAEQGDSDAQNNIGHMLYSGGLLGMEPNPEKAVEWFRKSAEKGNAVAQYNLARMYQKAEGVPRRNYIQAYKWFYIADKNRDKDAQKRLKEVKKKIKPAEIKKAKNLAENSIKNLNMLIKESSYMNLNEPEGT